MSGRRVVIPLKETIARSDAVVVAVPADPPERVIEINIAPEGEPPSENSRPTRGG